MRILYVLRKFPNISNTFIITEIVEIIKRGHDVGIISLSNAEEIDVKSHPLISRYKLLKRTTYLSKLNVFKSIIRHPRFYMKSDSLSNQWREGDVRSRVLFILNTVYEENYDVVHAHFAKENARLGLKAAMTAKVPFTFTTHAFDLYDRYKKADDHELKMMVRNSKMAITISEYNKRHILKICGERYRDRIAVVHCGIDVDNLDFRFNANVSDILTIARLVEKKGIDTLIKAMDLIVGQMDDAYCTLHIVGDGPMKGELLALSNKLGLDDDIIFYGHVSDHKIVDLYERAGLFVLPCKIAENGDRDGIPVSLMEAMAHGIPVISTPISGIPELIDNGVTGILVPPDSPEKLAEAISTLLSDRKFAEKLAIEARKTIEDEFNISYSVDKLIHIWTGGS